MSDSGFLPKLMNLINKAGTVVLQNLVFLISCIPIVTIGAAWSGLYGSLRFQIRKDSWFEGFKTGFKTHFIRNTIAWLLCLVVGYTSLVNVLYIAEYLVEGNREQLQAAVIQLSGSGLFLLITLVFSSVMIPVSLYIPGDANDWMKNTWSLIFKAPLQTLGCTVLMWLPVAMTLFFTELAVTVMIVFVAAYFVLAVLIMTILLKQPLIRILQKVRQSDEA